MRVSESVSISVLDDELVLLDQKTGKYFGLNAVAARMFQLLSETEDEDRIAETLATEFRASSEKIRPDLAAFRKTLIQRGFIETNEP